MTMSKVQTQAVASPQPNINEMANAIRALAMDAVQAANSGHPGMPMGMADVATVLFSGALKFDAAAPAWPNRDRFILSAGHGSMLLYALLYLTGYPGMTIEDLKNFRQFGSKTAGHPEHGHKDDAQLVYWCDTRSVPELQRPKVAHPGATRG